MSRAALAFMILALAGMSTPQPVNAWESRAKLFRCLYLNAVRVCYGGYTKVFHSTDSYSHTESCDIFGMKDVPGVMSLAGLTVAMNSFYGPNYLDMRPHQTTAYRNEEYCLGFDQKAEFSDMTQSCVSGGTQGFHVATFHEIRWREGAHLWRGQNISTTRSLTLPWPLSSCDCGTGNIPANP